MKQILTDAGEALITPEFLNTQQGEAFLKKLARELRGVPAPAGTGEEETGADGRGGLPLLARLLVSDTPRSDVCRVFIQDITRGSLQSIEELYRVCNLFGLDQATCIKPKETEIRGALEARNEIVHEMDVQLASPARAKHARARRQRKQRETIGQVKTLLQTAKAVLQTADKKLSLSPGREDS